MRGRSRTRELTPTPAFDGLIVENHGDIPFSKPEDIGPETAAHMAIATDRVRAATGLPIGINVLANAALHALAIASAASARFVRVNQWANAYVANEGLIEGAAAKAMRYRSALQAQGVNIFADAHVKHGAHAIVQDRPIAELVRDVEFFNADVVIFTGQRTGHAADLDYLRKIRAAASLPTLVGSGVDPGNVERHSLHRRRRHRRKLIEGRRALVEPRRSRTGEAIRRARQESVMSDTSSFSERMRAHADRTWRAILRHRFFREVATDAINDRVFARYLRIEYGFVDTAARALGYAVAKAPSFQERRRLGLGLYGLVTDQEQVFVDAFERMGAPGNERTGLAPQGLALPLHALFLKVAETEGYEEILACTLAAEWMYLTWCSTANQSPSSREYHSRLGRASRRRRLCRTRRVGPLGNRHKRTDAHRSPAGALGRAIRRGLAGGNRFPRRALRWVIGIRR